MDEERKSADDPWCAVTAAIEIIQEKWVLQIVRALLPRGLGFNELSRSAGGCNPATLTQRLERLEALGILTKEVQSYMPPRTRYTLTKEGIALEKVIDAIGDWGASCLRRPPDVSSADHSKGDVH